MGTKYFKIIIYAISFFVFAYHIINLFYLWVDIPDKIAIHFTDSKPDNWGPKYFLFGGPTLGVIIWLLIGWLVRKPEKLNYVNLTEANKKSQHEKMKKVMAVVQNASFLTFIFANETMLRNAIGLGTNVSSILSVAFLAICIIAPIYQLIWAVTLK